jgi:hypothetical protein
LALIIAEALIIWIAFRKELRKGFLYSLGPVLAALPYFLWGLGRNYRLYGTMMGGRSAQPIEIIENLLLSVQRILSWFFPQEYPGRVLIIVLLASTSVFLLAVNRKRDWLRWFRQLLTNPVFPVLLVTLTYFISMTVTAFPWDHQDVMDDRYQVPLFFALGILIFSGLDSLVIYTLRGRRFFAVEILVVFLFFGWLSYSIQRTVSFIQDSQKEGVIVYNLYNTRQLVRSGLVVKLKTETFSKNVPIYSNDPEAAYFFIHRVVKSAPKDSTRYSAIPENYRQDYPSWPPEPHAYLIWFKPNTNHQYYNLEEIAANTRFEYLYKRSDGGLIIVSPKK